MRSVWRVRGSNPAWIKNGGTFSEIPLVCKGKVRAELQR